MKNKKGDKFSLCRRGYDKEAVDKYIALEQAKADELQIRQRECICNLKIENDHLKSELALFKSREEQIKLALVNASDSAKRLEEDVKMRCENELERLRLFRAKWINAYEQLKERYHFDKDALNIESVAVSCEIELKKMLAKDFALDKAPIENEMEKHFRHEVERLANIQISEQKGVINQANDTSVNNNEYAEEEGVMQVEDLQNAYQNIDFEGTSSKNAHSVSQENALSGNEVQILKKKLEEIKSKRKKVSGETGAFSLDEAMSPISSLEQNCQAISLARK